MKRFFVAFALVAFCSSSVYAGLLPGGRDHWPKYSLLKMVETCDLVVTGEVTHMNAVFRPGIQTDVTIDVETVVKGELDEGATTVVCTIIGGDGVNPATGERESMRMTPEAQFEIGEDVVVFLRIKDNRTGLPYPAGGYYVWRAHYGKRPVEDNKMTMMYPVIDDPDDWKSVEMPVDMAMKLGKASLRDRDAAVLLENRIKALVRSSVTGRVTLSTSLIDELKRDAQGILDRPKPTKTTK